MRVIAILLLLVAAFPLGASGPDEVVRAARARWDQSRHGETLRRILPPNVAPNQLPEPTSPGARLTVQYCVQCHNLVNPAMHDAEKWPRVVERMLPRMQGKGNMGPLMHDLMAGMRSPSVGEQRILVAYLQKHAQQRVESEKLPEADRTQAWQSYTLACAQCHTVPDPQRHTRNEWPAVVARMEKNMQWMNRVVGSKPNPAEPRYATADIVAYLQRHARP